MEVPFNSLYNYCCYDRNLFHGQSVGNNSDAICCQGENHYGVKEGKLVGNLTLVFRAFQCYQNTLLRVTKKAIEKRNTSF